MNYQIVELEEFTGPKASVYSVLPEDMDYTFFDSFVEKYYPFFEKEVQNIINALEAIGKETGAKEHYFKLHEGKPGDGICAIFDIPNSKLRLYCIRWGTSIVLLGGGGHKTKSTRAWQDDTVLKSEVNKLMQIGKDIQQRIIDKEITFSPDGRKLLGNLNFMFDEE